LNVVHSVPAYATHLDSEMLPPCEMLSSGAFLQCSPYSSVTLLFITLVV
jgi:hypothetical protein